MNRKTSACENQPLVESQKSPAASGEGVAEGGNAVTGSCDYWLRAKI